MLSPANVQGTARPSGGEALAGWSLQLPTEGWGGGQWCSLVCRTRAAVCLPPETDSLLAWAAFINTLAICCGHRFRLTTSTHRHHPEREGRAGTRCEEHSHRQSWRCFIAYCINVSPCLPAFSCFLPSLMPLSSPALLFLPPIERSLLHPAAPQVLHNQIFDLMKGCNYWLSGTGGVWLLLLLFLTTYHFFWQQGVRTHVQLCVLFKHFKQHVEGASVELCTNVCLVGHLRLR